MRGYGVRRIFYVGSFLSRCQKASAVKLTEDEAARIVASALKENSLAYREGNYDKKYYYGDAEYSFITVEIGLPYGSLKRNIAITRQEKNELDSMLCARDEYARLWCELPDSPTAVLHTSVAGWINIDAEDAELVYEALLRDVAKMTFEEWYGENQRQAEHNLTVVAKNGAEAYKFAVPITERTEEAYSLLTEKLAEKTAAHYDELIKKIKSAKEGSTSPLELSLEVVIGYDVYFGWFYVDNSEEGGRFADFIIGCLENTIPSGDNVVLVGVFEGLGVEYFDFSLSDKYTAEEIKQFFADYTSEY